MLSPKYVEPAKYESECESFSPECEPHLFAYMPSCITDHGARKPPTSLVYEAATNNVSLSGRFALLSESEYTFVRSYADFKHAIDTYLKPAMASARYPEQGKFL